MRRKNPSMPSVWTGHDVPIRGTAAAVVLAVLLAVALAADATAEDPQLGPVPLRAISPLRLLFFQLTPEGAGPLGKGESLVTVDISESNVLHTRNEHSVRSSLF